MSEAGKANKRKQLAKRARDTIAQSKVLAQVKEVSERQLQKWDRELDERLKLAVTSHDVLVYGKLWDRCSALQGAERLAWLNSHAFDPTVASALLTAPAALTGLKKDELALLRSRFESSINPQAAEERPLTLGMLDDLDRSQRNALNRICEAAHVKLHELDAVDPGTKEKEKAA